MDNYQYERELYQKGINYIGGIDEVGRGPLIGPVVAACVVLPKDLYIEGLTDSKKLSEKKRNYYYEVICEKAIAIGIGVVDEKRIDEINIYEATKEAMLLAIKNTNIKMEYILIDAMPLDIDIPHTSIIKGDLKSLTISASSSDSSYFTPTSSMRVFVKTSSNLSSGMRADFLGELSSSNVTSLSFITSPSSSCLVCTVSVGTFFGETV